MLLCKLANLVTLAALLCDVAMFLLIAAIFIQGFRYVQVPMMFSFLFSQLYFGSNKMENLWLIGVGTGLSMLLYYIWGGFDYDRMQTSGPFDVGYREFTSKTFSNDCSVFYPVDKDTPAQTDKSVYYLKYGESLESMVDIQVWMNQDSKTSSPHIVKYLLRCFGFVTLPVKN